MTCGIYSILNKENGKIYVGQSIDIEDRFKDHVRRLNNRKHPNKHLQYSWEIYGVDSFDFGILEKCSESKLNVNEIKWIDSFDSTNNEKGYNLQSGGNSNFRLSEETRKKIGDSVRGEKNGMYGRTHTKEVREKLRQLRLNTKQSFETKKKISESTNTCGYYRVGKKKNPKYKQGFMWVYYYRDENNKRRYLASVDLDKLKQKVLDKGFEWIKFE